MLRRYIERKEREFAFRDTNRRVLPFEIGEAWLPPNGSLDVRERLRLFVEEAVRDSGRFFRVPADSDYEARDDQLLFHSPLPSGIDPNDLVHARLFLKPNAGRVVIILPHWNAQPHSYFSLSKVLNFFNISTVRLSLPYHDARRPPYTERSDYMVSPNVARTLHASQQSVVEVRAVVRWLRQQGFQRIGVMGTSIGSCIGYLAFAHEPDIRAAVFNHVSNFFADVVWSGLSTRFVRRGLEPHVGLEELRYYWSPISPHTYIRRVKENYRPHLLITARYDTTFLPELTEQLFAEYRRLGVPYERAELPCGHYTTGMFPFSYYDGYLITRYFLKHL
ncbi:MAG: prolyl oligopeptidase family serine peptidase [Acidobacteria bacterium]|nr:prolyl oligopeptidase family serine peptidase [Acidobacteriota bacterium]